MGSEVACGYWIPNGTEQVQNILLVTENSLYETALNQTLSPAPATHETISSFGG